MKNKEWPLRFEEKQRIRLIRSQLAKHRREGTDVSNWEPPFFLRIIDRLVKELRKK